MKILKLRSENFLRLKAVEITPEGNVVIISGANEAGKTSVLDSIYCALTGKTPQKPIREGEEKAEITIETETFQVVKTITAKKGGEFKSTLKILDNNGRVYTKPQAMLDNLLGRLAFDPLEFSGLPEKEKKKILLEVAKINTDDIDSQRSELYGERTLVGREAKNLTGEVKGLQAGLDSDTPNKEFDQSEILNIIEKLQNERTRTTESAAIIERAKEKAIELESKIDSLQLEHSKLTDDLQEGIVKYSKLRSVSDIESDLSEMKSSLASAEANNIKVRVAVRAEESRKKMAAKNLEYETLSSKIESLDKEKAQMIEDAVMPIDGLSFNEDGVLFNDIPFQQLSSAQQLKISMAMAMAMNPEMRIIRIANGSLLDSKSMAVIKEMAGEKDFQVWIEVVDESGEVGIYIEEGEIK